MIFYFAENLVKITNVKGVEDFMRFDVMDLSNHSRQEVEDD